MRDIIHEFTKNSLHYKLVKRSEHVAMYEVLGAQAISYEVVKIIEKDDEYGHRLTIPSNAGFGGWNGKAIYTKETAEKWYDAFNEHWRDTELS